MDLRKASSAVHFVKRSVVLRDSGAPARASWVPNTDVYVCDDGLVIKVELAGMSSGDLELTVDGSRLRISGERSDGCRPGKCKFLVMEINYGPFESVIELPEGYDLSQAKAVYINGFLRVDVPPVSRATVKKVKVSSASGK